MDCVSVIKFAGQINLTTLAMADMLWRKKWLSEKSWVGRVSGREYPCFRRFQTPIKHSFT